MPLTSFQKKKVEWAHDSAWRFLPVVRHVGAGYRLHPIDLAINKVLALAGRDEARDFLDVLTVHTQVLELGALCWAAVGKDPGFSPGSLLEMIRRRGKYREEDFARLHLSQPVDLHQLKTQWLEALGHAESFVRQRPKDELGCLYYSRLQKKFVAPRPDDHVGSNGPIVLHFGRPGGVLPTVTRA